MTFCKQQEKASLKLHEINFVLFIYVRPLLLFIPWRKTFSLLSYLECSKQLGKGKVRRSEVNLGVALYADSVKFTMRNFRAM